MKDRMTMSVAVRKGRNHGKRRDRRTQRRIGQSVRIVGDLCMNKGVPDFPCGLDRAGQKQEDNRSETGGARSGHGNTIARLTSKGQSSIGQLDGGGPSGTPQPFVAYCSGARSNFALQSWPQK